MNVCVLGGAVVCARMRARVRACVRVCVRVCRWVCRCPESYLYFA